jgi:hypothetical protein
MAVVQGARFSVAMGHHVEQDRELSPDLVGLFMEIEALFRIGILENSLVYTPLSHHFHRRDIDGSFSLRAIRLKRETCLSIRAVT